MSAPTNHRWGRWAALAVALTLVLVGLPQLAGVAQAASDNRVNLRVLVMTTGGANPNPDALAAQMDREGVPYTEVDLTAAGRPVIDAAFLADAGTRTAKYQAVVLPDPTGGGLLSAEEQIALATYERTYGIRQVNAYAWPGPDMGMNWPTASGVLDGGTVTVEAAGRSGPFGYLDSSLPIDNFDPAVNEISGAFAQPLSPLPAGATFTPLLTAAVGANTGVLAGAYAYDGREQLTITAGFNANMQVFNQIAPGIVDWMTRGIHLGYQRNYFAVNIDDVLVPDGRWSVTGNCTPGDNCVDPSVTTTDIRMTAEDVDQAVAWQNANDFKLDMTFNSGGIQMYLQDTPGATTDPLADALLANKDQFPWISHTVSHTFLGCIQLAPTVQGGQWSCATTAVEADPANAQRQDQAVPPQESSGVYWASQAYIQTEVQDNITWATVNGLPDFDPAELVTGEHSGLRTLPSQPADNPFFGPALSATGVKYVAADASREPGPRPAGAGTVTVPRYPMNIFYNAGTYLEEVDEYNWIYNSRANGGGGICEDNPQTSTCITPLPAADDAQARASFDSYILPIEIRNALNKVLTNDPRPFYAHQSNLAEDGILYPVLDGILGQYRTAYADSAPLVRLDLTGQSQALARMAAWNAEKDGVTAYLDSTGIQVPDTSGPVPLTVPAGTGGVSLESYGGALSGWLNDAATAAPTTPMGGYVGSPSTTPAAPTAVSATAGDQQATISWIPPTDTGGRALTNYAVATYTGTSMLFNDWVDPSATSFTRTGLTNGTPYTLVVTAQNSVGPGQPSQPTTAVTPLPPLPGAPGIGEVTAGNASATVTWTEPTTGGAPASYELRAFAEGAATPVTATVAAPATSGTVSGLTNGTAYTLEVVAINLGGSAPSARSAAVIPVGAPGAPGTPVPTGSDGQVTVTWAAPASDGGSPITGYTVTAYEGDTALSVPVAVDVAGRTATVTGLSNGTAYTFTVAAVNGSGSGPASDRSAPATPAGVPGAPAAPSAVAGNGQATVTWTAPADTGGSPITGYTVTAYQGDSAVGTPVTVGSDTLTATVDGLTNGTAYTFTVTAGNAQGDGPASARSAAATPTAPAPGAPTVTTVTPGDQQVSVTWTAPADTGGATITGYTVTAYQGDTAVGTPVTVAGDVRTATVDGLTNGTAYTFAVAATDGTQTGSPSARTSEAIPRTVPGAPGIGAVTAGQAQATVTWSAPADDGGSSITDYTVTTYEGSTAVGSPVIVDGSTLTATVTGLTPGTAYTFTVSAVNAAGPGPDSERSGSVTVEATPTAPGAPAITTVTPGNGEVAVAWSEPANTGGSPITGYQVIAYQGDTPVGTPVDVGGDARTATVTGLTNGQAYSFTVAASNDQGPGAASARSEVVTLDVPITAAGAPAITGVTAGNASVGLTWTAPASNGGSPVTGYRVTTYQDGTAVGTALEVGGTTLTATVDGLANGTAYTFTVAAQNAAGWSAESAQSAAVTPTTVPGAPTIGTATAGNASASVAWTPSADTGGSALIGYEVRAFAAGATAPTKTSTVGASATGTTVTGLVNGTSYTFEVVAINGTGPGTPSARSNAVTPGAPTAPGAPAAPTAIAGDRSASVTWAAPESTGGSPITAYVVSVYRGTNNQPLRTVTVTGGATTTTVTGLTNGTAYTVTVAARNAVGTGPASVRSASVTPATLPAAPSIRRATAGNGSATVSWRASSSGGSPITGYVVSVFRDRSSQVLQTVPVGAVSQTTVTGLTNGTAYRFRVAAVTAAGTGRTSGLSSSVTPRSAPGAPEIGAATPRNRSALVTWSPPADAGGSRITGYVVKAYRGDTATVARTVRVGGSAVRTTVSGLSNGTAYTFTVTAVSAAGSGPESARSPSITPARR